MAAKSSSTSPDGLTSMPAIILSMAAWFCAKNGASAEEGPGEAARATAVAPRLTARASAMEDHRAHRNARISPSYLDCGLRHSGAQIGASRMLFHDPPCG